MADYPEIAKMAAVREESQVCGNFLSWLEEEGFSVCERGEGRNREHVPVRMSVEELLARYFEIDLRKVEAEKHAMIESFGVVPAPT